MVYAVMSCWCYDGDTDTEILEICDSKEKAEACLKLMAEFDYAEFWESMNLTKDAFDAFEWTNDYYNVEYEDTRITFYIVEKELK